MTNLVAWYPGVYGPIFMLVAQDMAKRDCPEHILRDDVVEAILKIDPYWPTMTGLKRAVTKAILQNGYIHKIPRDTRKVEYLRQDLENDPRRGYELRIKTYKQQYPALAPAIAEVLKAARYPAFISANKLIADLDERGISARTKSLKTVITYLMPELGYDLKRDSDGRIQQQNKVRRIYYKINFKRLSKEAELGFA